MEAVNTTECRRTALGELDSNVQDKPTMEENITKRQRKLKVKAHHSKPTGKQQSPSIFFHSLLDEQLCGLNQDIKLAFMDRTMKADAAAAQASRRASEAKETVLQIADEVKEARALAKKKQAQLEQAAREYTLVRKADKEAASHAAEKREEAWKLVFRNAAQSYSKAAQAAQTYGQGKHKKQKVNNEEQTFKDQRSLADHASLALQNALPSTGAAVLPEAATTQTIPSGTTQIIRKAATTQAVPSGGTGNTDHTAPAHPNGTTEHIEASASLLDVLLDEPQEQQQQQHKHNYKAPFQRARSVSSAGRLRRLQDVADSLQQQQQQKTSHNDQSAIITEPFQSSQEAALEAAQSLCCLADLQGPEEEEEGHCAQEVNDENDTMTLPLPPAADIVSAAAAPPGHTSPGARVDTPTPAAEVPVSTAAGGGGGGSGNFNVGNFNDVFAGGVPQMGGGVNSHVNNAVAPPGEPQRVLIPILELPVKEVSSPLWCEQENARGRRGSCAKRGREEMYARR